MPTQDIYEIEPNTAEQADALKAFAKALKMRIERKDKPYNAEFVAKIKKSQQQAKEGKVIRVKKEDWKEFLGI